MVQIDKLPKAFLERFSALLGDEFDQFLRTLAQPPEYFVRVNTLKISLQKGQDRLAEMNVEALPLPYYPAGFRIRKGHELLPRSDEYALGYFYIQEGASMAPPLSLAPTSNHLVLDMCAAPGSKTTQIAQMMENQGAIIANDRTFRRITSLGHNLQLCGVTNTVVLREDGRHLPLNLSLQFDRILVDAPCSASGHLRGKAPQFEPPNTKRLLGLQALQKGLLKSGFKLLKPGGRLVYSTCSLHPEENEAVIQHLLDGIPEARVLQQDIQGLVHHPGLTEWETAQYDDTMRHCLRVYPHDNNTDGFFIATIGGP
jgi:NOL1/NOP2/sun family putative RNA methylase